MLFNSIDFAIFVPIVFILYWFVTNHNLRIQNLLIVMASYVFYAWWDWRFLFLMVFSISVDYLAGLALSKQQNPQIRRVAIGVSILVKFGLLGFFKYYNFFLDNFTAAFSFLGHPIKTNSLNIILPVGISFYTFQALSYTIDVYNRKIEATKDYVSFSAFVSFFPQLVAGPIERATHLLPQFYTRRVFDYSKAVDGLRQILYGLFKKVVIADNCAYFVNMVFNNSAGFSGSTLIIGALFFAFQIYGDFSGYSDIAIGVARLFGFDIMRNFAFPYFSRDIAEFWRRWHISLTTWFRDYLYIPLGGSRGSIWSKVRNIFIVFIVSGFWHGANWTFIIWGVLNAIFFMPLLLLNKNRSHLEIVAQGKLLPSLKDVLNIGITFSFTVFAWIFFRAENIGHALNYISKIFSNSLFQMPEMLHKRIILLIGIFCIIEWFGREQQYAIANIGFVRSRIVRWSLYYLIAFAVFCLGGNEQQFIYFQF